MTMQPCIQEQHSELNSTAGKDNPRSPAISSSVSQRWRKRPERLDGDQWYQSPTEPQDTVLINRSELNSFLKQYCEMKVDEKWCRDIVKELARECTDDPTFKLKSLTTPNSAIASTLVQHSLR
jgi:hypothetical protein